MTTNFDLDCPAHGCEIVVPIVVNIPFYIEPVVLEQSPNCDGSQRSHYHYDLSTSAVMPDATEPTVSASTLKQPQTQLNSVPIKSGWFHWLQSLLLYFFPEDWHRVRHPG